jgi:leucyl-tRNA synthetase
MFLQLYKNGLAYRKKAPANWCIKCHTVLANEQVVDGKCERCGTGVVKRDIEQWLFKITKYANKLLNDLEKLDWPEKTKIMQKNWIGRSEGTLIKFEIRSTKSLPCQQTGETNSKFKIQNSKQYLEVFTTRLDTILGCTYCVIAPEHEIISKIKSQISNAKEVNDYITKAKHKLERERLIEDKQKTGVELKGIKAVNPATNKEIPIFVSDYILVDYGTGAIMAVPAYDERDFEFAKKFNLAIINAELVPKDKIIKKLGAKKTVNYKLRDWLVSRQRYWGAPIPIVYCEKCGSTGSPQAVPVPEKDLPVLLPKMKNYLPTEEGKSPLARSKTFVNAKCPRCHSLAKRETDTMDTFVCSSWYYLRYTDSKNNKKFASPEKIKSWLPVDMYVGGAEHTVMHLLYSRFFTKALKDFGLLNFDEPFTALRHQGIVLGTDGQKMSKSRGNVINPDELIENFGADAMRVYLCFMSGYSQGGPWNASGIIGTKRFLERVWKLKSKNRSGNMLSSLPCRQAGITLNNGNDSRKHIFASLDVLLHKTIKKVTEDIEALKFNTAISALMILLNEMEKQPLLEIRNWEIVIKLLASFAPHISEELWHQLGHKDSIHIQSWPKHDSEKIKENVFNLVVQINGKVRDIFEVETGISKEKVELLTLKRENVKKWIKGKLIRKVIFVENKLINIVISQS